MKKSAALFLVVALAMPTPAHAGSVRDMIARAKSIFEAEDEGRGARRSAAEFMRADAARVALIAQKNQLAALENSNFSNRPTPPAPVIPPDVPSNPGAGEDEFFDLPPDLPPMEEPKKDAIIHGGTLYGALLKHGADIRQTDSDFFRAVSDFVRDIFIQIANRNLAEQWIELDEKIYRHWAVQRIPFFNIAYQAALMARSYAYEAVQYFNELPVESGAVGTFLAKVEDAMSLENPFNENGDGSSTGAPPQFIDWDFDPYALYDLFEFDYTEIVTDEQGALYDAAIDKLDHFSAAVYASQQIYGQAEGLGGYYWKDDANGELNAQMQRTFLEEELTRLQAYIPDLSLDGLLEYQPYIIRSPLTYQDEKGNSVTAGFGIHEVVFSFDGTLTQGMQEYVDNAQWQWLILPDLVPSPSGEGYLVLPAIPIEDKYGDFMAPPEPSRSLASNDREIFNEVLAIKTIETGQPTRWEFRDPNNLEVLASVEIPDSEALPANSNPIGLGLPIRIKEIYQGGKLVVVEIFDLSSQSAVYIQPTRYSDQVLYDPVSGQVFEGVITNNPQTPYNGPFSAAMHDGEEDEDYFDDYFEYTFLSDDEDIDDLEEVLAASTKETSKAFYYFLPGINSEAPEGVADKSVTNFANALISRGIASGEQVDRIAMFEGANMPRDLLHWSLDARGIYEILTNEVLEDLRAAYSDMTSTQILERQVVLTHSGSTNPTLKAISRASDLPVDVMISYGGPTYGLPNDFSENPRFKTYVNVWGSNDEVDMLVDGGRFWTSGMLYNHGLIQGEIGPKDLGGGIETINLMILNASHSDFWYSREKLAEEPDFNRRIINQKTSYFMQKLAQAAGDPDDLRDFLSPDKPGVSKRGDTLIINLDEIVL